MRKSTLLIVVASLVIAILACGILGDEDQDTRKVAPESVRATGVAYMTARAYSNSRSIPTRQPTYSNPGNAPNQISGRGSGIRERCIEQFLIVNGRGKYAVGRISDNDYMRAQERLFERGLLGRQECGAIWDSMR